MRAVDKQLLRRTVGIVEDVENMLPLVVSNDVDDGGIVQRPDVKRKRHLVAMTVVHRIGDGGVLIIPAAAADADVTTDVRAPAQRLVHGGRGADDRKLERGGELGDDVRRRTGREAEQRQQSVAIARYLAHCTAERTTVCHAIVLPRGPHKQSVCVFLDCDFKRCSQISVTFGPGF